MPSTDPSFFKKFKRPSSVLAACFISLVVFSVLGLDLINKGKGEKSYIFVVRDKKPKPSSLLVKEEPLEKKRVSAPPPGSEKKAKTESESAIPAPVEEPVKAAPKPAEKTEAETGAPVAPPIGIPAKKDVPQKEERPIPDESPDLMRKKGKVAIIVDDMGFNILTIEELCSLGLPLTIAILPYSPWAVESAYIAQSYGLEVILHLPMESINDHESNEATKGLIHSAMSEEEILITLEDNLAKVPFIQGVNNHMGSKITAQRQLMMPILKTLKEKNLYFIDSVTTGKSIAYQLARQLHIPTAERHVFLDTEEDEESIRESLVKLFRLARRRGEAVGICHPLETTVKVLLEYLPRIEDFGCEAVSASEILH
jgi:polysaccharide deacetylase 2 family uncharacterized protein YibQ